MEVDKFSSLNQHLKNVRKGLYELSSVIKREVSTDRLSAKRSDLSIERDERVTVLQTDRGPKVILNRHFSKSMISHGTRETASNSKTSRVDKRSRSSLEHL